VDKQPWRQVEPGAGWADGDDCGAGVSAAGSGCSCRVRCREDLVGFPVGGW